MKIIVLASVALGLVVLPSLLCGGEPPKIRHEGKFHAHVVLVPTVTAPAKASGTVDVNDDAIGKPGKTHIHIETHGLDAGTYDVSALKVSDGTSVDLGSMVVRRDGHGHIQVGNKNAALPSGFDLRDISQVVVSDASSNAVLVGDFANPDDRSNIQFRITASVEPGPGAPNATGQASIDSHTNHGKVRARFELNAKNVPPGATFDILADGASAGQVASDAHGMIHLHTLTGVSLSTIHQLQLTDATAQVVLTCNF